MFDKGHARHAEKRKRLRDFIVARFEQDARDGREATPTGKIAKDFGTSHKTCEKSIHELRKEGRISWRTVYYGSPLRQVRVVTVIASGLTTAELPKPAPKPRKSRAKGHFNLKPRVEKIGISDRQIYGTLDESVKVLRHRGYVVFREQGGVRVGNALLSFEELAAKAAREARLMGAR